MHAPAPRWEHIKIRPMPPARFGHAMALAHGRLAIFGGCLEQSSFFSVSRSYVQTRELWLLELGNFSWSRVDLGEEGSPQERMCHTLTALPDGSLLLLGGRKREGICEDAWLLDVSGEPPAAPLAAPPPALQPAAAEADAQGPQAGAAGTAESAASMAAAAGEQVVAAAGALVAGVAAATGTAARPSQQSGSLFSSLLSFKVRDTSSTAAAGAAGAAPGAAASEAASSKAGEMPSEPATPGSVAGAMAAEASLLSSSAPKSGSLLGECAHRWLHLMPSIAHTVQMHAVAS
jgi:host cell factor